MYRCELTDVIFSDRDLYSQHRLAIADNLIDSYCLSIYTSMIDQLSASKITPDSFFENLDLSIINRFARGRVNITYALETELKQAFDITKIEFVKWTPSVDGVHAIHAQIKISFDRKSSYLYLQKQYNVTAFSQFELIKKESISDGYELLTFKINIEKYAFAILIYTALNINNDDLHIYFLEHLNKWWPHLKWEWFLNLHTNIIQSSNTTLEELIMFIQRANIKDDTLKLPNLY